MHFLLLNILSACLLSMWRKHGEYYMLSSVGTSNIIMNILFHSLNFLIHSDGIRNQLLLNAAKRICKYVHLYGTLVKNRNIENLLWNLRLINLLISINYSGIRFLVRIVAFFSAFCITVLCAPVQVICI